ncbi:MAG: hypothetical protein IJA49_04270 [Oscillospiraceae bacterium]|nr:hypothetical protein [Oscillospiraceae bacterium]
MKRLLALVLAFLLLAGCSSESLAIEALDKDRDFGAFHGSAPTVAEANRGFSLVQTALSCYPGGFPEQWGRVNILLVGDLTGEEQFTGGHFAGFTQKTNDGWLMVLDAGRCDTGTVHHEIAHILDGILTEAGALTEADWMAFCPSTFSYGNGDFGDYPDFFADEYAMENMKEDRARTFEEAMLYGAGVYEDKPALWLKLEYFSRAIRAHFDTESWPEKTAWEQALE